MAELEGNVLQPGDDIRPIVSRDEVKYMAQTLYRLDNVQITELDAYDDKNFHLQLTELEHSKTSSGTWEHGYVLKILNSLDSKKPEVIDAQNEILLFLGNKGIVCPQPVKNLNGQYLSVEKIPLQNTVSYKIHIVRLLTYQPGEILYKVPCTAALMHEAGYYIANLDILLKDFHHEAYENHKSAWMLESVPLLKNFIFAVQDENKYSLASKVIECFETNVLPETFKLERGVIHGDFNEHNILVQKSIHNQKWHIYGVLDFGDAHFSCYIYELAITICYMMLQCKIMHPFDAGGHVIAGYIKKRPLPEKEFLLLKKCICARLCQSLVLGAYSHLQNPTNQYLLTTAVTGWSLLDQLWRISEQELFSQWKKIIASYN